MKGILGILRDKLRIVALNSHMHLLPHFDRILVLEKGMLRAEGTPEQLFAREAELMARITGHVSLAGAIPKETSEHVDDLNKGGGSIAPLRNLDTDVNNESPSLGLISKEQRVVGQVKLSVYATYFSSFLSRLTTTSGYDTYYSSPRLNPKLPTKIKTPKWIIGLLTALVLISFHSSGQAVRVVSDLYLVLWSQEEADRQRSSSYIVYYYTTFGVAVSISILRCLIMVAFSVRW